MPVKRIIVNKGGYNAEEAKAAAAFTPGHLLELTSAGKVQKHSTEGGIAERLAAVADVDNGKTIDDAYALDDNVQYAVIIPGTEVFFYVKAGESYAIGDELISAGDGALKKASSVSSGVTAEQIVSICRETIDLSGSGAVDTRILTRVL